MAAARDIAARVRAARAFADLDQAQVATRLDMSVATLRRVERGERTATRAELRELADITGVPTGFLESGWDGAARSDEPPAGPDEVTSLLEIREAIAEATAEFKRVAREAGVSSPTLAGAAEEVAEAVEEAAAVVPRKRGRSARAS